jgi:hypothetical protein
MGKSAKTTKTSTTVTFAQLRDLLGKPVDAPAFVAAMARSGKVVTKPDFVIAKEAGFDFAIGRPDGAKRNSPKVATTLFLYGEGGDKHRAFVDLPFGLAFSTRADLLARLPAPKGTWKIGKGDVPVTTKDASHDRWLFDGVEVSAHYDDGEVGSIIVQMPPEAVGGRKLATNPLHFAVKPVDAPADAVLVGMALLVAWAAEKFGVPPKHAKTPLGKQLLARAITPRAFLIGACDKTLTTLDVDAKLEHFLNAYVHRLYIGDAFDARDKTAKAIAKLLVLDRDDERAYNDDFLGTFAKAVENPYYVPDSWDAVDRIAPVLDARWADFQATAFDRAPELGLYERAAKLRDAHVVTADRAPKRATPGVAVDDKLAGELVALVGRVLADADVKSVLARAGLPIGKKIDEQANPALGVSYMGVKLPVGDKRVMGVDSVCFYASKQRSYIRGIGSEVEFVGYPAALPLGLAFGDAKVAVVKRLGKPSSADDGGAIWRDAKRRISCKFASGKLVQVDIGLPPDWR